MKLAAVFTVLGALAIAGCGYSHTSEATVAAVRASEPPIGSLPSCTSDEVKLRKPVAQPATQGSITSVSVRSTSDRLCRLRTVFALGVHDSDGAQLAGIRGNPGRASVDVRLRPGAIVFRPFGWWNWCGDPDRYVYVAQAAGDRASARTPAPVCGSRKAASWLRRLDY